MWIALAVVLSLALLLLWELWVCEGTHLGRRFVVWMYDLAALRYDGIKGFDTAWEQRFLGEPLAATTASLPRVRLLDVGAGTGRVVRSLRGIRAFDGTVLCLEASKRMLALGREHTAGEPAQWVHAWAVPLPFDPLSFDLVVSLEILEFTPNPRETLGELVRVLRPGGWLLITNRIGWQAPLILGKSFRADVLVKFLESLGMGDISVTPWQLDYDLVWARKRF